MSWVMSALTGPPAIAAVVLAIGRPDDASWWLAGALLGAWGALIWAVRGGGRRARCALVAMPVVLALWPEMALRVAAFRHDHALTVQFGYPPPDLLVRLRPDDELFWKLPLGHPGSNSEGFLGREFEIPKPPGTYRMLFFGDSCTMQGYPALVEAALAETEPPKHEAVNFGIAGYTSHQGLVLAERWAARLEADLGVVFFGWNDHWLAYGAPDSQKALPAWRRALQTGVRSLRIAQWFASLGDGGGAEPLAVPRVSRDEYASNLEQIGETIARAGGEVMLVTAPTSMDVLGVPGYVISNKFAVDAQAVEELHAAYNQITRDVARRRGWRLLDLAAEMPREQLTELFLADRIHFSDAGLAWLTARIVREVTK